MTQPVERSQALPDFAPTLVWAGVLMVLLQFTGSTSWMFVPPGILALGAMVAWQRLPGIFFASMPLSLLLETTGQGIEDFVTTIISLGESGQPRQRGTLVALEIENITTILLWFGLGIAWIGGFREVALRTMAWIDPFPGPPGRTGPSPLSRSLIPPADGRRQSWLGLVLLGVGILMVMILQFASLHQEMTYLSILRIRFTTLAGGAFLVMLAVRAFTGYLHWRAMPPLEAGMVLQEGSWREGSREFTALDRWLSWARLSARLRAERQWKRLLRRRKSP